MTQVNMFQAKTELSRLIRLLETGQEDVIYLARNNRVVADLTLHSDVPVKKRIGAAKGMFTVPDDFDLWDRDVAEMFGDCL